MNDRPAWLAKRASERGDQATNCNDDGESKKPQQVAQPSSLSFSLLYLALSLLLAVAPLLMYKTLRAFISYYSLFLYAIRTSISVFVVVHKKHISATTTTLREPGLDSGRTDGQWDRGQWSRGTDPECGTAKLTASSEPAASAVLIIGTQVSLFLMILTHPLCCTLYTALQG